MQRTCLRPRAWQLCFVFGPFTYLPSARKTKNREKNMQYVYAFLVVALAIGNQQWLRTLPLECGSIKL